MPKLFPSFSNIVAKAESLIQTLEKKNEKPVRILTQTILESLLPQLAGKKYLKSDQVIANSIAQNDVVVLFEKLLDQEINKMNLKIKKEKPESVSVQGHTNLANAITEAVPSVNENAIMNLNVKNNTQRIEDKLEKAGHQC